MRQLVDDVLAERRSRTSPRRQLLVCAVALVGHALLGAAIAMAPIFVARSQAQEREYIRVMIVPAKALGDSTAPPKPKPKPAPVAPAVETRSPKPAPTETAPEPEAFSGARSEAEPPASESTAATSRRRGGPDGTSLGISPFGTSEASFDDPDFRYGYYVQQMLAIIGSQWVRPRSGLDTEVVVHYRIDRSGRLSDIEVVRASGNRSFDAAGIRAVTLASPLPPLPQSYPHDSLGVTLLIR